MKKYFFLIALLCLLLPPAAQAVEVRAGLHERSNRMVFDWNKNVAYTVTQQGNNVTIQFNTPDKAQLAAVLAVRPPYIKNLNQETNAKGLAVTFQIPDKAKLETFRLGNKTAFDVVRNEKTPPTFSDDGKKPQGNLVPAPASAPETPVAPITPLGVPENKMQLQQPAPAVLPPPAESPEAKQDKPRLQTLADRLGTIEPRPDDTIPVAPDAVPLPEKPVAEAVTSGTRITLKPAVSTKLAVFVRAGKLWLVLDKALPGFMPQVEGESMAAMTQNARRIDLPAATAFVFDAIPGATYATKRNQTEWQIWINATDKKYLPDDMPVTFAEKTPGDTRQNMYAGEEPTLVPVKDSLIGDKIWVVPVRSPEGRISRLRNSPGYQFLPTLMGAAIILQDDMLQIEAQKDTVSIFSKTGKLPLSDARDRAKGLAEAHSNPVFSLKITDLKAKEFTLQRQELQTRLAKEKNPDKKAAILMTMARLYVAQGFGQEAAGILRMAQDIAPKIEQVREYQALRGMASALSADVLQAEIDLKSEALQSQPAAKVWLGYAQVQNNQWQAAKASFLESDGAEEAFPDTLRPRLILAKAETALKNDDIVGASRELKKIADVKKLRPSEKAAYDYISASTDVATNHKEDALPVFEELAKGNNQLYRVKAELDVIAQKLAAKEITLDKAIDALERLRFSWRGDRLEIDILQRLGQYYIDNKQYMEGLGIWRQAAGLSKNTEDTDAITQNMQDVFKKLYVDGTMDKMQPLQAVALFERFRELIPPGQPGVVAIEHLADRLASVDLLDEADALLDKQVRRLPPGEEAAKLGSKLASWRLQNSNAETALKALDDTAQDTNIPEELSQRRLLLRARALADLGRVDEGLSLLSTVQSEQALSLKADINWRQNRWAEALEALQGLVTAARNDGKTTSDGPMPTIILKMAIALTMDGNPKGLELLKAQYGDFMAKTPKAQAFNLITTPSRGSSLADLDTLKGQVGEVELFQSFLKDFGK